MQLNRSTEFRRSGSPARALRIAALLLLLVAAFAPAAAAQSGVVVVLSPTGGSGVSGSASLTADGAGTRVALDISGLAADTSAQASLHAGTCAQPSASFSALPPLTANSGGNASVTGRVLFRGQEDVALSTVADGQHVIAISSGGRVVACGVVASQISAGLNRALLVAGEQNQVMQFNPAAALQKRIFAEGFVPNSAEFRAELEATRFAVQRAEHMRTGSVRVYWAREGVWNNVMSYLRGSARDTVGSYMLEQAEQRQAIRFNPDAALQKRIFADGFVPNSGEFRVEFEGRTYVAQRAEHLGTGRVRIYFATLGDWGNVRIVERGTGGPAVSISPLSGPVSTQIRVTATGFPANTVVTVWGGPVASEGIRLGEGTTDASGRATITVQVSGGPGMCWVFGVVAGEIHAETGEFTITG